MIEIISLGLLVIFTIHYIYFIININLGLNSLRIANSTDNRPNITVIVSARNEEKSIGRCLQSLVQQTYPSNKYEILIIDDGSTDTTNCIVTTFSKRYPNVHLLSLTNGIERAIGGSKPLAISRGVTQATGEIIITTDADCIAPPKWLEIMASHFENNVVFVAGPVAEQSSKKFFSKLEQLELLGLITTTAGLIGSGRPIICNGANLAYRKSAFISVDGFGKNIENSNDDEMLMNRIAQRNIGKIVFAPESDAVITTQSSNTIKSFLKQRIRWANKRGRYEDKSILITLVSLYLFFLSLALAVGLIPFEHRFLMPVIIVFAIKLLIEYFTLYTGAQLFLQRVPIFHFLIAELLHVPYIVLAAAIGQLGSMKWKGRTITQ